MTLEDRQFEMWRRTQLRKIGRAAKLKAKIIRLANTYPLIDYSTIAALAKGGGEGPTKQYVSQVLRKAGYRRIWELQKARPGEIELVRRDSPEGGLISVPARDRWRLKTVKTTA